MKYLKLYESFYKFSLNDWFSNKFDLKPEFLSTYKILTCDDDKLNSLDGIEKITNIRQLAIIHNQLTTLKGIENCTKLNTLYCYGNKIKDLEGIKELNLKYLSIGFNNLRNLNGIEKLTNLEGLFVQDNFLKNLNGIEQFTKIQRFHCENNLLKNLDEVKNFPDMTSFICKGNPWEYPLPEEFTIKYHIRYSEENKEHFRTYRSQKAFLTKYPERANELKEFGFHKKIREEFPDLIEGSEFGFFNLR